MTEATTTESSSTSATNAAAASGANNSGSAVESSNDVASSGTRTEIDMMRGILGKSIKCTLDDGRIATGTFVCMDRLKNLILTNVIEERYIDSSDYTTTNSTRILARRELSQAMVPGSHLLKVEVDQAIYESHMINHDNKNMMSTTKSPTSLQKQIAKITDSSNVVVDDSGGIIDTTAKTTSTENS